jgi:hypothetical protein
MDLEAYRDVEFPPYEMQRDRAAGALEDVLLPRPKLASPDLLERLGNSVAEQQIDPRNAWRELNLARIAVEMLANDRLVKPDNEAVEHIPDLFRSLLLRTSDVIFRLLSALLRFRKIGPEREMPDQRRRTENLGGLAMGSGVELVIIFSRSGFDPEHECPPSANIGFSRQSFPETTGSRKLQ